MIVRLQFYLIVLNRCLASFKQSFAQVTNPPIDSIREHIVTSTVTLLGAEGNLLQPNEENCRRIELESPILTNSQFVQIKTNKYPEFKSTVIDMSSQTI